MVQHRKSGFLARDLSEMIQFIDRVPELDRSSVRAYVERNFSVRAMAENYTRMYKKIQMPSVMTRPTVISPRTPLVTTSTTPKRIDPVSVPYPSSLLTQSAFESAQTSVAEVEPGA